MSDTASHTSWNVLVLCTGNSARSIMAEALFNILGEGRFRAFSAGSHPNGRVNPFAIEKLKTIGYPTDNLHSKSWDEFAQPGAPKMDFVITVCDNASGEVCPIWPGMPVTAHWGFEDPGMEDDADKRASFHKVFEQIRQRVSVFAALPLSSLDALAIKREMDKIGEQSLHA